MAETDDFELQHVFQTLTGEAAKRLDEVLGQDSAKDACLQALASLGCHPPSNEIVFYCLRKALLGANSLFGRAAASRLEAYLIGFKPLARFLVKLVSLQRQAGDTEKAKEIFLECLRDVRRDNETFPTLDEETPFPVLSALYLGERVGQLDEKVQTLLFGLREDIASELRRIDNEGNEPHLAWVVQKGPEAKRSIIETLCFNSDQYPFSGREREFDFLERFLGDLTASGPTARFRWLVVTGPGGEGKSRLALEFSRYAEEDLHWKMGKLDQADLRHFNPSRWLPRQPTCIVIDYPAQAPEPIGALLRNLQKRSSDFDWPVRVLFLERDTTGEWLRRVLGESSDKHILLQHVYAHDGQRLDEGWQLRPLHPQFVTKVMMERLEQAGIVAPPDPDWLLAAASRIDRRKVQFDGETLLAPRPLFAMAVTEALILSYGETGQIAEEALERLNRLDVFARLIERDRDQRWRPIEQNKRSLDLHENLFALATFCSGLSLSALGDIPSHSLEILPDLKQKAAFPLNRDLLQTMSGGFGNHMNGLEPDILGEYFVIERLGKMETHSDRQALCDCAFSLSKEMAANFVSRCLRDFPDQTIGFDYFGPSQKLGEDGAVAFAILATRLVDVLAERGDWNRVGEIFERTDVLRHSFRQNETIVEQEAMAALIAAVEASRLAEKTGDWDQAEVMLKRIDDLRSCYDQNERIAISAARVTAIVALNAGRVAQETRDWRRVDAMLNRLEFLRAAYDRNEVIAAAEATAVSDIAFHASTAGAETGDWNRLEAMLGRLDNLRCGFPKNAEIALTAAGAWGYISNNLAARGPYWSRIDAMFERLNSLRDEFPQNEAVAEAITWGEKGATIAAKTWAMAVLSGAVEAVQAGDWSVAETHLKFLEAAWRAFAQIKVFAEAIACEEEDAATVVKAATSIILSVGAETDRAGDWNRAAIMLERLDVLRCAYSVTTAAAQDEGVAVTEAIAAATIVLRASRMAAETRDWELAQAMIKRLDTVRRAFPNNETIALAEARAAYCIVVRTGSMAAGIEDWNQLEVMLERLVVLSRTFKNNKDIADIVSTAATIVSNISSAAKQ